MQLLDIDYKLFYVQKLLNAYKANYIGEGPASQPQSTLSCWKKLPTGNKKF